MKKTLILILLISVLLCGCGRTAGVTTDGSTSMEKAIGALGETFKNKTGTAFTFNPTGSGAGINAVREGRCDIGLSSRELKEEEREAGLVGTLLAYDGIVVIVNPDNPVDDLSLDELSQVFTGKINNWSQLGGDDAPIVLIGREAGSGTRDGFEAASGTTDECDYRLELTSAGDVITSTSGNPNAIGYASLASIKNTVKAVSIDGVAASGETIKSGSYAVQRPFLLVTLENKPLSQAAQSFFDYATSPEAGDVITAAGFVPAN